MTIHATTPKVYSQMFACSGEKSLIPIHQQTSCHKNSPTSSLSVFTKSEGGRSYLLNKVKGPEEAGSDKNKIKSNGMYAVSYMLFDESSVASGLAPPTFWREVSSCMGFYFFLTGLSCVLET